MQEIFVLDNAFALIEGARSKVVQVWKAGPLRPAAARCGPLRPRCLYTSDARVL